MSPVWTISHLDIVLDKEAAEKLRTALLNVGFEESKQMIAPTGTSSWVTTRGTGSTFMCWSSTTEGLGIYGPPERGVSFPVSSFAGRGEICGREVHCLDAEFQVGSHTEYKIDEDDIYDVLALCARFGLTIPLEYRKYQADNPSDPGRVMERGFCNATPEGHIAIGRPGTLMNTGQ